MRNFHCLQLKLKYKRNYWALIGNTKAGQDPIMITTFLLSQKYTVHGISVSQAGFFTLFISPYRKRSLMKGEIGKSTMLLHAFFISTAWVTGLL